MNDLKTVGERLRFERKRKEYKQKSLAWFLKVAPGAISRWENDKSPIPSNVLEDLADEGWNVAFILGLYYKDSQIHIHKDTAIELFAWAAIVDCKYAVEKWKKSGLFEQVSKAEAERYLRNIGASVFSLEWEKVKERTKEALLEFQGVNNDN